ncbi:uncharacterized protein LOC129736177 [Falco cherrug]|uniref:uncharacterized protein LOC129736177 n=1 Tax=Falco cherrug TaxID=345164 RepID=UPI00247B1106|nr:uncharacterized protein LOC129736177 [Falco cherrug]
MASDGQDAAQLPSHMATMATMARQPPSPDIGDNDRQAMGWWPPPLATTAGYGQEEPQWPPFLLPPRPLMVRTNLGAHLLLPPRPLMVRRNLGGHLLMPPWPMMGQDMTQQPSPATHGQCGLVAISCHPWPTPGRMWLGHHLSCIPTDPWVLGDLQERTWRAMGDVVPLDNPHKALHCFQAPHVGGLPLTFELCPLPPAWLVHGGVSPSCGCHRPLAQTGGGLDAWVLAGAGRVGIAFGGAGKGAGRRPGFPSVGKGRTPPNFCGNKWLQYVASPPPRKKKGGGGLGGDGLKTPKVGAVAGSR